MGVSIWVTWVLVVQVNFVVALWGTEAMGEEGGAMKEGVEVVEDVVESEVEEQVVAVVAKFLNPMGG